MGMTRAAAVIFVVALALGCRDQTHHRSDPDPIPVPKIDVAKVLADTHAKPAGAYDFELVPRGNAVVVRDSAYELVFPIAPELSAMKSPGANPIDVGTMVMPM